MRWVRVPALSLLLAVGGGVAPVGAAEISGVITDPSGGVVSNARVVVRDIASGIESLVVSGADGRYTAPTSGSGTFLVLVEHDGFSPFTTTVTVADNADRVELPVALALGSVSVALTVTPARAERDARQIPLHIEAFPRDAILASNPLSTGDAIANAASVTIVGSGPYGVRPRLRGLDSTRLLVLVDGERLNTARTATERAGTDVGLVATDEIARVEVINGAGTLMYGTDALAGTINIITNEPTFSATRRWDYGFNGYYSSNENGLRGSLALGTSGPRYAVRVQGGAESYDDYTAGQLDVEDTRPYFESGQLHHADTIDDAFGFNFDAFPEPFNTPYVRTSSDVPNSKSSGHFFNASGLVKLSDTRALRVRYQQRRVSDTGFPDFVEPYFFNVVSLPKSNFDRVSVRYEAQAVTPWLANISLTGYYQRQVRLLENLFPVQFPAPTPTTFYPISVFRLNVKSETTQQVWTPGIDLQAVLVPAKQHLLTTGLTVYRDRSEDERTTETTTTMLGQVALGARGPAPVVFPSPVELGGPVVSHPVRVPNATFRDIGVFAQDEWKVAPQVSVVAGLRGDFYAVKTEATPGYDVTSIIAGALPPIDPATLPDPNGATYVRSALTGDVGVIGSPDGRISPFVRYGRSFRHPNLEEMLFAGPATTGAVIPNVLVEPEIGRNFDTGAKFNVGRVRGGAFYFLNHYSNFIAAELVVATTPRGPLAQATNFANVRIQGVEVQAEAPLVVRGGVVTLAGAGAFMRGTVAEGENPLDGSSLADTPADNITPSKVTGTVRYTQAGARWWAEYGIRAQGAVERVASTLLDSPFLIPQDLLSLDGFVVQRVGAGMRVGSGLNRASVTFAIENLTNRYYREHFQFAPARGRSFTIGIRLGS